MELAGLEFFEYNEERHKSQYMKMIIEYSIWLDNKVYEHYGVRLFQDDDIPSIVEKYIPIWTSIEPPDGIVYIMEVEDEIVGMGRLDTFSKGVGEVHNIWTNPEHRGKGYATRLMSRLEDRAREYGLAAVRLDTARFNVPAINLYKKIGYREIDRYRAGAFDNESLRRYYEEKVYMEKTL